MYRRWSNWNAVRGHSEVSMIRGPFNVSLLTFFMVPCFKPDDKQLSVYAFQPRIFLEYVTVKKQIYILPRTLLFYIMGIFDF